MMAVADAGEKRQLAMREREIYNGAPANQKMANGYSKQRLFAEALKPLLRVLESGQVIFDTRSRSDMAPVRFEYW
jgi:hypothetical protein